MKLNNKTFDVQLTYPCGLDKYDIIHYSSKEEYGLVIRRIVDGNIATLTVYPFTQSKYMFVNWIRFVLIRTMAFLNII